MFNINIEILHGQDLELNCSIFENAQLHNKYYSFHTNRNLPYSIS